MQSWVLWGREREKKKVVNSPHAQHLNHALSTTSPSCHTAWENPSCLFWRTQFATPRGINKTSVNQYATDKLGFFFFNILWKKWLPEGLKMLLRNPEIAAQPFYLTQKHIHSFSSLLHMELSTKQGQGAPVQKQQLCTIHTTLLLFHRTALCKLCCLCSFSHCQTVVVQFCVLMLAPARGNRLSCWAPNFVCTDFLEQFSIYSSVEDTRFKTKGVFSGSWPNWRWS